MEVENAYKAEGSLSTIYVISLDHSTILQNLMVQASSTSEVSELPKHLSSFYRYGDNENGKNPA